MAQTIKTSGYYFGYKSNIIIQLKGKTMTLNDNFENEYEINSDDSSNPSSNSVTIYNLSDTTINKIKKDQHIIVKSGPSDLYGILSEGNISKIEANNDSGKDRQLTIQFIEGANLSKVTYKNNFNGAKTVKSKSSKKVNLTFKKNTKAKAIIQKIAKVSGIKIYSLKLRKNKVYKRGYSTSKSPLNALKDVVKDCNSTMYQRKGKLVIDDGKSDNPYKEHLYLSIGSGLLSEPNSTDDDNDKTYTLQCFDDPRLMAGSSVNISSKTLKGLKRVKSVQHTHQKNYVMEVVVYA